MSDSKRATLITVGTPKSSNNNVNKTVRLTINLDESNESKYPELNYKELVASEEFQRKKKLENGKTKGLDPFSDNDDDVEKVARKFEQKYGGKSNYGKKGRSKVDDFADIGAGYDENDSFIDNTDGYDEMIPPECDTFYGGFYINCGDLEFKSVPENQIALSDAEPGSRKNKRRISSSSSEESSDSSSESSQDEKEPKTVVNGTVDSHETEHRKKKNKKTDKKKPKKKQRTDSSAATSGKQTSDDNIPNEAESADSRTSDSVASKPAPSSENAPTSDSSRDIEAKTEVKLPVHVSQIVEELESLINKQKTENPALTPHMLQAKMEPNLFRLDRVLQKPHASTSTRRIVWSRVARALNMSRPALLRAVKKLVGDTPSSTATTNVQPAQTSTNNVITTSSTTANNKRKNTDDMTDAEREQFIVDNLKRLKTLIDEKTPGMMATYNAECERVLEERKKLQIASGGAPHVEKRLPKRRFPWCARSRQLLAALAHLAAHAHRGDESSAVTLLTRRVLPLFPPGFVRLPTLLRQADLSKEFKASDIKRQRAGSTSNPIPITAAVSTALPASAVSEPITFPPSLTVTTSLKSSPDKNDNMEDKDKKSNSMFGAILNSITLSRDLVVEPDSRLNDKNKDDLYIPPNSIGSITITPVPNQNQNADKKVNNSVIKQKEPLLRVKSPAALNEMVKHDIKKDREKPKKVEKIIDKQVNILLHIDTSYQTIKKNPSPKDTIKANKPDHGISQKQIENMRNTENNIPRPALVPVHHSPTFAKPDKRPPEPKKKKEILIVSDVDPLSEPNDPVCVDSDSDIEVIEDTKSDSNVSEVKKLSNSDVPCTDKVTDGKNNSDQGVSDDLEEPTDEDLDMVFRNIREMTHSQEQSMVNPFGGVITSAQN